MANKKGINFKLLSTIVKYLFSVAITLLAFDTTGEWKYVVLGLTEIGIIIVATDVVYGRNKIAGQVLNCILCFLYNAQMTILFFGNSFLQLVMVTNLASIQTLGGKALEYGMGLILVLAFSFLPICSLNFGNRKYGIMLISVFLLLECAGLCFLGIRFSPALGYVQVVSQAVEITRMKNNMESVNGSASDFYSPEVEDHIQRDPRLPESPNVILIFTEGLSQNVISDERNFMPNLKKLQERSISFSNYFNHTFATYRGLSGQLYSGFQLNNLDENNLVSLQDIFKAHRYHTTFINTEPANQDFTGYLHDFDFDEVLGTVEDKRSGMTASYSDKEAYELLYNTACSLEAGESPYFLCIYTYGTHVSLDSVDEIYGDGTDPVLNKFYNLDIQLGLFLERFQENELFEDTILILTADHATYQDSDFTAAFPDVYRAGSMVDEVPFCIYYQGVQPRTYDVGGRNSLSLAPTILDFLDISEPNYFLGKSLFAEPGEGIGLDTTFNEEAILISTKGGDIRALSREESDVIGMKIQQYFVAKNQSVTDELIDEVDDMFTSSIETVISSDGTVLEITYRPRKDENYRQIWFPVWSAEGEQDDKIVYPARQRFDGKWVAVVDLTKHTLTGELHIHVYGGDKSATDYLSSTVVILG